MKYARIISGIVQEVIDFDPAQAFHPEVAALFVQCPDEVQAGWLGVDGMFTAPPVPTPGPTPAPTTAPVPKISPIAFKLLFTIPEALAIQAARKTDTTGAVEYFWSLIDDPRLLEVDLNLLAMKEFLNHLAAAGLLTPARVAVILAGPQ